MKDLAETILTDLTVQQKMLAQAQAGELHPSVIRELPYIYNGRPVHKMEIAQWVDTEGEARRAALRLMPKAQRLELAPLLAEAERLALPQATVVSVSTPEPAPK